MIFMINHKRIQENQILGGKQDENFWFREDIELTIPLKSKCFYAIN